MTKHGVRVPSLPDFTYNFITGCCPCAHAPKNMKWRLYGYAFAIMRNCVGVGFDCRKCILYGIPWSWRKKSNGYEEFEILMFCWMEWTTPQDCASWPFSPLDWMDCDFSFASSPSVNQYTTTVKNFLLLTFDLVFWGNFFLTLTSILPCRVVNLYFFLAKLFSLGKIYRYFWLNFSLLAKLISIIC